MNKKTKKILFLTGAGLDVAITVFLFVIAIIMLATMPHSKEDLDNAIINHGPFIGYLQQNPTIYFWALVFPLIVLFVANIVFLVLYVRKLSKKPDIAVDDLSDEQKAALRAELLKDLENEKKESEK